MLHNKTTNSKNPGQNLTRVYKYQVGATAGSVSKRYTGKTEGYTTTEWGTVVCVSVSVCVCVSVTRLEVGVYFVCESVVVPALVLQVVGSYQSIGWQGSIGLIGLTWWWTDLWWWRLYIDWL